MDSATHAADHPPAATGALALLLADGVFGRAGRHGLARVLAHVAWRRCAAGTSIYRAGDAADTLYLVRSGAVELAAPHGRPCAAGMRRFGEEAASDAPHYLSGAVAVADSTLLCIPRGAIADLLKAHPGLRGDLLLALGRKLGGLDEAPAPARPPAPQPSNYCRHAAPGWLLAIALPCAILAWGHRLGLDPGGVMFLAIFSATIAMWVFNLADDYIPALFALLATLLTGLVPAPVVLSGFASDGFLMALSTLALGTVVASSGLGYRVLLLMLHRFPNRQWAHNAGLFALGLALTPVIPTANGRIALLAPFCADMVDSLRLAHRGRAATRCALSCLGGASLFSAVFMTSKSVNFVVYGLLSPQQQYQFQWLWWLTAALVAGVVLLAAYALAAALWLRNAERPHRPDARIAEQRALLGPVTEREWAAILGVAFLLGGIVTSSVHKVQPPWLGFAMLFGMLLCGTLDKKELKEQVDWTFLLYLSSVTGIVAAFDHLGLSRQLGAALPDIGATMRVNFGLFVLLLFVLVNLVRLAVPTNATAVMLATIFMPLAHASGVNEWLVGFLILLFAEGWFFPYQCSYYLQLQEMNRSAGVYDEGRFLRFNAVLNLARLPAVYLSMPYWSMLGIL